MERNLALKVMTKFSEKKKLLKLSIFVFLIFGLILLVANYSFSSSQNAGGLNYAAADFKPPKNNRLLTSETNESSKFGQVTSMPMRFNRFITRTSSPSVSTNSSNSSNKKIFLDFCNLPDIDPWDSTIMDYVKPEKDHMRNCVRKVYEHSKLIDGQLFIYSKGSLNGEMNCQMRCLFPDGESRIKYGDWIKVINGTKPECDIIEIKCRFTNTSSYKYLHAQIYRNVSRFPPSPVPKPPEKYDVHIIVLDSVSQTEFIRSMPKTVHMLREQYEAIPFKHLNKVGSNSHENGFGFLFGRMTNDIPKSPFSKGHSGDYSSTNELCKTSLENEQFIGFRYEDDGYVTLMSEDLKNLFIYPNCTGFNKTVLHHYMRPFQLHFEELPYLSSNMDSIVHKGSCRESYYDLIDYLKDFIKAYPDKPKFSITWVGAIAHDYENALSSSDDYFYRFFKDTQKDFENSFLFILGDHGMRFGKIRETQIGEIEVKNPVLYISVPKALRNNPTIMEQLRTNSKELITHYDIYATLVEIAQPKNPRIANPVLHGSSLFHPLPTPRTCDSLRIPFELCKCHTIKTLVTNDNGIGKKAAKMMIEQINFNLSTSTVSTLCSKLSLNEDAKIIVEDYGGEQVERIYKITFSTLPGNGKFWGIVSFDPSNQKLQILSSTFMRLDSYDAQAKCAIKRKSDLAPYCYCKSLLNY